MAKATRAKKQRKPSSVLRRTYHGIEIVSDEHHECNGKVYATLGEAIQAAKSLKATARAGKEPSPVTGKDAGAGVSSVKENK